DVLSRVDRRPKISAWHWDRQFGAASFLRHARLGRGSSEPGSVIGAGIFLSSEPVIRDDSPPVAVAGAPGPGWDVEAYRDDMLVHSAQTDSTGRYTIAIPVSPGSHRLTVAAYGPAGEHRFTNRHMSATENALVTHSGAYDLAIGRCEVAACDYAAETMLRYAPFSSVTAGTGLRFTTRSHRMVIEPSLLLATHPRDDINASVRHAGAATRADVSYAPSPMFDASFTYANTQLASTTTLSPVRYSDATASAIWRVPAAGYSAGATLTSAAYGLTDTRRLRVFLSLPLGSLYIRPFIDVARQSNTPVSFDRGLFAESPIPFLLPTGSRIRAGLATSGVGDNQLTITAPFLRSGKFEFGIECPAGDGSPRLVLALNMITRAARYEGRSTSGANGSTVHAFSGSLTLASRAHT